MVNFKKIVAVLCSATMIVATPITAFAEGDTPPTIAAGTGNIVAYSATTVTVPTAVKVSFNPQGWKVYLDANDTTGTTDQIVSLNYAISSMATMDRKIAVSFEANATGTPATGKKAVEFVDTAAEAAPKTEQNPDGAAHDELKVYLAVAGGSAKVTTARDASSTAFGITDGVSNVTGALLADVVMTAATGGAQAFKTGETKTESAIAFTLGKGVYELKSDAHPSFDTTQAQFAAMVQPKTLGDIVGFTFTGAMNTDADWTKADLTAISITPTYEIDEADGTETAVTGGGYNQIIAGEVPATETTAAYDATAKQYKLTLPTAAASVEDITNLKVNGVAVAANSLNSGKDIVRVARPDVRTALTDETFDTVTDLTFTFTFGGVDYTATVGRDG